METPLDNTYQTRNTALAAWLYSQGFELLDTDITESDSVVFLFKNDDKTLKEAVRLYQLGQAEGNINIFFGAYKKMLRRIKGAKYNPASLKSHHTESNRIGQE